MADSVDDQYQSVLAREARLTDSDDDKTEPLPNGDGVNKELELSSPSLAGEDSAEVPPPSTIRRNNGSRCWVDVMNPQIGSCETGVTDDDRHVVTHFFGRNKASTGSIPEEFYPVFCRRHYQQPMYRNDAKATAKFQCDCIIIVLKQMIGDERWVGFELQPTKQQYALHQGGGRELEDKVEQHNRQLETDKMSKREGQSRRHRKTLPDTIPDWLNKHFLTRDAEKDAYPTLGGRNGVRYSCEQLITIIKHIKQDCERNDRKLPAVEAIPITAGQICAYERSCTKRARTEASRLCKTLKKESRALEIAVKELPRNLTLRAQLMVKRAQVEQAETAADLAERSYHAALIAANATKDSLPPKRLTKKSPKEGMYEEDDDEGEDEDEYADDAEADADDEMSSPIPANDPQWLALSLTATSILTAATLAEESLGAERSTPTSPPAAAAAAAVFPATATLLPQGYAVTLSTPSPLPPPTSFPAPFTPTFTVAATAPTKKESSPIATSTTRTSARRMKRAAEMASTTSLGSPVPFKRAKRA